MSLTAALFSSSQTVLSVDDTVEAAQASWSAQRSAQIVPGAVFNPSAAVNGNSFTSTVENGISFTTSTTGDDVKSIIRNVLINSTTESVRLLKELTSTTTTQTINRFADIGNDDVITSDVIIKNTEVTLDESGIGTAQKVVIGAVVVVVVLTIVALVLRFIGPYFWEKSNNQEDEEEEDKKLPIDTASARVSSGFSNFGASLGSNSSVGLGSTQSQDWSHSTGSTPISDWSEVSSENNTKGASSENQSENNSTSDNQSSESDDSVSSMSGKRKPVRHSKMIINPRDTLSVASFPVYKDDDRLSSRSSPGLLRRGPGASDEKMSTHSNLSHTSHPSESRLSLLSVGSLTSSMTSLPQGKTTFPIPSRDLVRQMHLDKDRRYPTHTKISASTKKEKHVRISSPTDRTIDEH